MVCKCFGATEPYLRRKIKELDLRTIDDITSALKAGGACSACHYAPGGLQDILNDTWGRQPTSFVTLPSVPVDRREAATAKVEPSPYQFAKQVERVLSEDIRFSIRTPVYSPKLQALLNRGDLLSDQGVRIKTNPELLARFQPPDTKLDYGLDALYVWPNGEIWFSTEEGFTDKHLGPITSGDLLSDDGYIVYRNLEMVGAFQPLEDLYNFGLDALFVVTDVVSEAASPWIAIVMMNSDTGDLTLRWEGSGKVFQVEKAGTVNGPYVPLGEIIPGLEFIDAEARERLPQSFYRIRQW